MRDSDPIGLYTWLAEKLNDFRLAYLHIMRADLLQQQKGDVLTPIRKVYNGVLVSNMFYTPQEAKQAVAEGGIDAVAFGTSYLANPDLPERLRAGAPLNQPDPATFYVPGPNGYNDYPTMEG
jgi:N-ethylmaleimide reductase